MKIRKSKMSEILQLANQGRKKECDERIIEACKLYTNHIAKAIGTYPAQDGAFIVVALRHIANNIERRDRLTKKWAEILEQEVNIPPVPIIKRKPKKGLLRLW